MASGCPTRLAERREVPHSALAWSSEGALGDERGPVAAGRAFEGMRLLNPPSHAAAFLRAGGLGADIDRVSLSHTRDVRRDSGGPRGEVLFRLDADQDFAASGTEIGSGRRTSRSSSASMAGMKVSVTRVENNRPNRTMAPRPR